jgi:hypothetical protein
MVNIKDKRNLIISVFLTVILVSGYFIYERLSLTKEDARDTSKRVFNMLMMKNLNETELGILYPAFDLMGSWVILQQVPVINNISRNSDGDYEVYATYRPNKFYSYSIFLLIGRENNNTIIKSSKGINYAYYDKVFEYGKKKGCLTGNEDDIAMGMIISDKSLRSDLNFKTEQKINSIYYNIKIKSNLKENYGYVTGNVIIMNNNNFVFEFPDLQCRIDFYDRNNQITDSKNETFMGDVGAYGSASTMVYSPANNSVTYKVTPIINNSSLLFKNKVKDLIIQEEEYGCK